jgi:hypothetical protein
MGALILLAVAFAALIVSVALALNAALALAQDSAHARREQEGPRA